MILKLTNNKNTYSFEVEDLNNGEKLFYHFQIPTADMEDGNYKMVLLDGDEIITEEQVCIGAYNPQAIQYSRGENVYINAPFEANLEDVKEVEITAIETTVLPSEGYDGIKAVEVNAHPIFDEGYNVGNADGIEVGKAEQKALLEPITITENGTYENENGYSTIEVNVPDTNGSYDEGYTDGYAEGEAKGVENAGEIVAANAIVLDATENKTYYTKYSDNIQYPEVTGVFPNGENFYNDISILDTKTNFSGEYQITPSSKIEIWWNNQDAEKTYGKNNFIFGFSSSLAIYNPLFDDYYQVYFFSREGIKFTFDYVGWHHIVLSANGLFINDKKIGDFNINLGVSDVGIIFNINNCANDEIGANGRYGMIKLDDTIIIPIENGFLNTNTNELLNENGGVYYFSNNDPIILDNLIKQVNVVPKINVIKDKIKFGHSSFSKVPEYFDFTSGSYENMFYYNINLTTPPIVTGKVTKMVDCFMYCTSLKSLPNWDFSECYDFSGCFQNTNLIDLSEMANWNYPHTGVNWSECFRDCENLQKCPAIYTDNAGLGFYPIFYKTFDYTYFTDFGGFIGLKNSITNDRCLPKIPNLTYESCINILNGLYDFTGNGETPASSMGQLKVHPNFLTNVGDEISIATAKGWTITA